MPYGGIEPYRHLCVPFGKPSNFVSEQEIIVNSYLPYVGTLCAHHFPKRGAYVSSFWRVIGNYAKNV